MIELANYLKSERIKRGISLEMLQEATKIRLKYLQAIESGDLSQMPGEVYLKGFLRSYAEFIGLDGTEVLNRYKEIKNNTAVRETSVSKAKVPDKEDETPLMVKHVNPSHKAFSIRSRKHGDNGKFIWAVGAGLVVLALAISVILYNGIFDDGASNDKEPIKTAAGVDIAPKGAGVAPEDSKRDDSHDGDLNSKGVNIKAFGISRSWIKVSEGDRKVFEGFLAKGETKNWHSDESLEMVFANAGGVRISYNGRLLGRVGPVGKLVTRVFKAASDKVAEDRPSKDTVRSVAEKAPSAERPAAAAGVSRVVKETPPVKVQSLDSQPAADTGQTASEPATAPVQTDQSSKSSVSVTALPATVPAGTKKAVKPPVSPNPAQSAAHTATPAGTPTASSQHSVGETTAVAPEPVQAAVDGGQAEPPSEPVGGAEDGVVIN